jgi:hypothetical protein
VLLEYSLDATLFKSRALSVFTTSLWPFGYTGDLPVDIPDFPVTGDISSSLKFLFLSIFSAFYTPYLLLLLSSSSSLSASS